MTYKKNHTNNTSFFSFQSIYLNIKNRNDLRSWSCERLSRIQWVNIYIWWSLYYNMKKDISIVERFEK